MPTVPPATPLGFDGRLPILPRIIEVSTHPKCQSIKQGGRIFIGCIDFSEDTYTQLFHATSQLSVPENDEQRDAQGYLVLSPEQDDRFLLRNIHSSQQPEDDVLITWSLSSSEHSAEHIQEMTDAQAFIIGTNDELGSEKPVLDDTGLFTGGLAFERDGNVNAVASNIRSYQLAATFQRQKCMTAPGKQAKVFTLKRSPYEEGRFRAIKVATAAARRGLDKGAPNLESILERQAEVTALPAIGSDDNIAWPAGQLNAVAATDKDQAKSMAASIGKFGETHLDSGDNAGAPTAMLVLTRPHPDLEDDYFYILDCGICWKMTEFAILFFSGLHVHGGCQPIYKSIRTEPRIHAYRITQILYPPLHMINGTDAVAFAALPATGGKSRVFAIGHEMRNPRSHQVSERPSCEQSTWASDGGNIMSPTAQLNHFSRLLLQAITYFTAQLPPTMVPCVDKKKAMEIVSCVIDNKRVTAREWNLGPGWSGEDTRIGKDYTGLLHGLGVSNIADLSPENLALLYNSDSMSNFAYGSEDLHEAIEQWATHLKGSSSSIPVCVINGEGDIDFGGRNGVVQSRTATAKRAREGDVEDVVPRSRKKKRIDGRNQSNRTTRSQTKQVVQTTYPGQQHDDDHEENDNSVTEPHIPTRTNNLEKVQATKFARMLERKSLTATLGVVTEHKDKISNVANYSSLSTSEIVAGLQDLTFDNVMQLWQAYEEQDIDLAQATLVNFVQARQLLLVNMLLWEWLEKTTDDGYTCRNNPGASGLGQLFNHVEVDLLARKKKLVYDAADYLPNFTRGETVSSISISARRIFDEELLRSTVFQILLFWLGFPDRAGQERAWFVRALVDYVCPHILLLPAMWRVCHSISYLALATGKKNVSKVMIQDWASTYLASHPVTQIDTYEYHLLDRIQAAIESVIPDPISQSLIAYQPPIAHRIVIPALQTLTKPLLIFLENPYPQISIPDVGQTPATKEAYWTAQFQHYVQQNTDHRLPFRNHAVSRQRILSGEGPYLPQYIPKREGLFSAIIYRGITHNSLFLRDPASRILYNSPHDWITAMEEISNPTPENDRFYCNPNAYGKQSIKQRSINNAHYYWDKTAEPDFERFLNTTPFPFLEAQKLFETLVAFGPLTAYQLTADYVQAGKVSMPSLDDMGRVIWRIGSGGLNGLKRLGFACSNLATTSEAFAVLYRDVDQSLTEMEKAQIDFGPIFVEHMLCKYVRLDIPIFHNMYDSS
ncbi:hypothetical protein BJ165DRAFT_1530100 [Panaeolus papilionaceus]|nr:hypothetical protein BJ165DRAFT_1530100 [Panaeolus papilionaceus]